MQPVKFSNRNYFFFLRQLVSMTAFRILNDFDRNQQNLWQKIFRIRNKYNIAAGIYPCSFRTFQSLEWLCYHWIATIVVGSNHVFSQWWCCLQFEPRVFVLMRNPQWTMWYVMCWCSMRFGERKTPLPLPQRFFPSAFNAHSWTFFVPFVYRYELLFGILTQSTQRIEI